MQRNGAGYTVCCGSCHRIHLPTLASELPTLGVRQEAVVWDTAEPYSS